MLLHRLLGDRSGICSVEIAVPIVSSSCLLKQVEEESQLSCQLTQVCQESSH